MSNASAQYGSRMKAFNCFVFLALAAFAAGANVSITRTSQSGETYAPGDLIFEDNFDFLDFEKWNHEKTMSGGGNWEFQVYENTRTNSYCRNGVLHIKPTLTNDRYGDNFVETGTLDLEGGAPADECTNPSYWGCSRAGAGGNIINPAMSARIRTVEKFYFKYGRVEVRAKIPAGDWLWPAIWMLPRYNAYGTWPASGEVDIMESRGNRNLYHNGLHIGEEQVSSTLHFGPYWPYNGYERATVATQSDAGKGWDRDFHVFGLEWTDQFIKFTLDGVERRYISPPAGGFWELGGFPNDIPNPWGENAENPRMAPFDQKFYLVINLAVGGTNGYFPDDTTGTPKPWRNTEGNAFSDFWNARGQWHPTWTGDDANFQIDYVRVYAV